VSEDQIPDPNGIVFSPTTKIPFANSTGKGPAIPPGGKGDMHVFDVGSDNKLSIKSRSATPLIDLSEVRTGRRGATSPNVWVSSNAAVLWV
jgi:gluconolactonase